MNYPKRIIKANSIITLILIAISQIGCACKPMPVFISGNDTICNYYIDTIHKTKANKFIIIIQDGVRFSEGFGDSSAKYIPNLKALSQEGTLLQQFYNEGITNTINGCTASITGSYFSMPNNGEALPFSPNILHHYLFCSNLPITKAAIISSKDKMEALANYATSKVNMKHPQTDCGTHGNGSGYRHDTITLAAAKKNLESYAPDIVFITFREPDFSGHTGIWNDYLNGIRLTDSLISDFYYFTQTLDAYKNNTNFFITNDHGRHLDSQGGFAHHGDDCEGCRHISLLAIGPDIQSNKIVKNPYELIDIPETIAYLLHLKMKESKGKVMHEILK